MLGGVSITTAATHVRVLCMRYCNGIIADILLHYLMKFHLEITKDKEMTTFLYVLSDHPTYNSTVFQSCRDAAILSNIDCTTCMWCESLYSPETRGIGGSFRPPGPECSYEAIKSTMESSLIP